MIVNAHHDVVVFTLPEVTGGRDWVRLIDTNLPEEDDDPEEPTRLAFGHSYEVTGRSLLLFLAAPGPGGPADASARSGRRSRHRPPNDAGAASGQRLPRASSTLGQRRFGRLGRGGAAVVLALAASAAANYALAKRAERRNPPQGSFVTVDGVRLHYLDRGPAEDSSKPAIVLLHGVGALTGEMTASGIVDALAADHRVIVFDRPGFGYSERPRGRIWTPAAQAALLRQALDLLGVERPVIVGHSWGTLVTLEMALRDPDRTAGLVLLSGYYFPTFRPDVPLLFWPAVPIVGDVLRYAISPWLGRLSKPLLYKWLFAPAPVTSILRGRGPERADLPPLAPPIGRGRGGAADPGRGRSGRKVSRIAAADRDRRGSGRPGHRFRAPLGTTVSGAAAQHAARAAPHRTHDPPFRARRDSGRDPRHGPRDASEGGGERTVNRDCGENRHSRACRRRGSV